VSKKKRSTSRSKKRSGRNAAQQNDAFCVTQIAAAAYAGVCVRVVRRWKNQRGMPVTPEGWYIKEMLDIWKDKDAGGQGALMAEHRQRDIIATAGKKEYQARKLAVELAVIEGKYHSVADCEKRSGRKVVDLVRGLEGMRRKVEARVPAKVRPVVSRIMKEEIRYMRQGFAGERSD